MTADNNRRGTAMIPDRNVLIVGQQRVVGSKQFPDARGVMDGGVEVGVVADAGRKLHLYIAHRKQQRREGTLHPAIGPIPIEYLRKPAPQCFPRVRAKGHQGIENVGTTGADDLFTKRCEQALNCTTMQVEDPVTNGDADARLLTVAKYPIGQILNWKIRRRIIGGNHPTRHGHPRASISFNGSTKEHEPKLMKNRWRTSRS